MIIQPQCPKIDRFQFSANFLRLLQLLEAKQHVPNPLSELGVQLSQAAPLNVANEILVLFQEIEEKYSAKILEEKITLMKKIQKELGI